MYLLKHKEGVSIPGCKPGPATVLIEEEEDHLSLYLKEMAEV